MTKKFNTMNRNQRTTNEKKLNLKLETVRLKIQPKKKTDKKHKRQKKEAILKKAVDTLVKKPVSNNLKNTYNTKNKDSP